MRGLFNAYAAWLDQDSDAFGGFVRMAAAVGSILGGSALAILIVIVIIGLLFFRDYHSAPPSLFCANGSEVHSQSATQVVGKTPVDGVRYTCG